eukprot:646939-Ditylum_brightwellii.AAC.1
MDDKLQFQLLPAGRAYLLIDDKPITRKMPQAIHNAKTLPALQKFIIRKFSLKPEALQLLEQTHFGQLILSYEYYTHRFTVQYISK